MKQITKVGAAFVIVFSSLCMSRVLADGQKADRASTVLGRTAMQLPSPRNVTGQSFFRCRGVMEADLTGSYDSSLTKGLEGRLTEGINNVSISIEDSKRLSFLSEAGFAAGVARGPEFQIVSNTQRELVASFFDGSSISTFVLNKSNGLAVWSKIRSTFPGYGAPTGSQSYLSCQ